MYLTIPKIPFKENKYSEENNIFKIKKNNKTAKWILKEFKYCTNASLNFITPIIIIKKQAIFIAALPMIINIGSNIINIDNELILLLNFEII